MNKEILARLPQAPTRAELIAKSTATNQVDIDVHLILPPPPARKAEPKTTCTCGGMLFELETGTRYCLNCGEL